MATLGRWEGGLRTTFSVGEPARGTLKIEAPNGETTRIGSHGGGPASTRMRPPDVPGTYYLLGDGERLASVTVTPEMAASDSTVGTGWNGRIVDLSGFASGGGATTEQEDYNPNPDPIDPSNYAGIVNADNEQGVALAPALRREGVVLGADTSTVTLPDGETVDVGAIKESDEVARYIEGDNAGDVVESDQPATDSGPSSSGGSGSGSGMIGAVGAGVVLILAAIAALLFGGD
ncbi:hypothetical protein EI982_09485 [Haloplanus rallus]|uniref:Uncharacterized protein n=1 Tax=Haloplanus rallus TaxID=1816183 RepID=A0A6B9F3K6_9EURY|nr:hypothetical protein [Haloplanus rallus]QGX95006.1 hypothetical protein EI982_09485 [Haloplanus rallus]